MIQAWQRYLLEMIIYIRCKKRFIIEIGNFNYTLQQLPNRKQYFHMILPQQNNFFSRFYFSSSAFSPLQQPKITHQALRKLRDEPTQNKIIKQELFIQQYSDKEHNLSKTETLSNSNSQYTNVKLFQKNSNLQKIQNLQFKSQSSEKKEDYQGKTKKSVFEQPSTRLRNKRPFKYDFDSQSQEQCKQTKRCQTKNIIKNFIRSVLSFLKKNEKFHSRLIKSLDIDQTQFQQYLQKLQGKINTISQLRQLWTQSKYSEAFRIISSQFLRKYYTKHIFNSRIFNHQIHLKYRFKLIKSLERPDEFTSLKEF